MNKNKAHRIARKSANAGANAAAIMAFGGLFIALAYGMNLLAISLGL